MIWSIIVLLSLVSYGAKEYGGPSQKKHIFNENMSDCSRNRCAAHTREVTFIVRFGPLI